MLLRTIGLGACVLALAACGGSAKKPTTTAAAPSPLPPGCSVAQVQTIVETFLTHPSFAPAPFFTVYRSKETDGRLFLTHSRVKALAHVRARLKLGELDRLIELRVSPQDINHVRIGFQLTRYGPDFLKRGIHSRIATGTGTVDCAHGKVAAWEMTGP